MDYNYKELYTVYICCHFNKKNLLLIGISMLLAYDDDNDAKGSVHTGKLVMRG